VKISWKILPKTTFGPKQVTKTGCWKVRSVWVTGCLNQVVEEMDLIWRTLDTRCYYIQGEKMNSIRKVWGSSCVNKLVKA
jgi:hypothetical protein